MAIKLPDPGNGIPEQKTGNDEWTNMKIVRDNFADQSNAASRLVGKDDGNLLEAGTGGIGKITTKPTSKTQRTENGFFNYLEDGKSTDTSGAPDYQMSISTNWVDQSAGAQILIGIEQNPTLGIRSWDYSAQKYVNYRKIYFEGNTTKDSNGFIKAASPVVDLYDDHIELNYDAQKQNITYKRLGTGNYLVKGSLGFAQEGWYIEMPKDANGNVLVAVVYEQLDNNDISIKTYDYMLNKKGRIVPDTETPLDIPEGRCINLRLHEAKEEIDEPAI